MRFSDFLVSLIDAVGNGGLSLLAGIAIGVGWIGFATLLVGCP